MAPGVGEGIGTIHGWTVKHGTYRDLISGSRPGLAARTARAGLKVASLFYAAGAQARNRAYNWGLLRTHQAPVPVVSVGNLTVGGTGKTPVVAAVVDWLREHGAKPVILSRGYRSLNETANDEKLVLDQLCPNVVHLQSPDRIRSAIAACRDHHADVLVLDDGFQHRRLARDLDIVLIDALDPWGAGAGHLLPRGLLREPRSSLKRADLVILTRADQCTPEKKERTLGEIAAAWPGGRPIEVSFQVVGLVNAHGETKSADVLRDPVAAFCGIGNPEGFRRTLAGLGMQKGLAGFEAFPDHHHYTAADLDALANRAKGWRASALITTQKDLVKIPRTDLGGVALWAVSIRAEVTAGREEFERALQGLIAAKVQPNSSRFQ